MSKEGKHFDTQEFITELRQFMITDSNKNKDKHLVSS